MRKALTAVVIVAAVSTSGCAVFRSSRNSGPDEFAVASNAPLVIEAVLVGRGGWMERLGLRPRHVDAVPWSAVRRCEEGVLVVDHEAWERERQRAVQNRPGE